MTSSCASICYALSGASQTRCTDAFLAPGLACRCEAGGAPNDLKCATDSHPRTRCCAPSGWPGPGLACACDAVACLPLVDGCNCVLSDNLDVSTAETCRGVHCCAAPDHCQCRPRPCSGGEREVEACSKAELACPSGTHDVASCSIRQ
jgi:hypothetical protein